MIKVEGKCGISATIVCDSVSEAGVRLTTMEIQYPRLILSELNTHRMLSKNSASSRAIPFAKMQEQLTGRPVRFGAAKAGMQDGGDCNALILCETFEGDEYTLTPERYWECAKNDAVIAAEAYYNAGYAKQVFNRLTEPFQMMKTVISGTEWANFFFLRNDSAADPTIAELARCMQEAREQSVPQLLKAGEYHLPYVTVDYADIGKGRQQLYFLDTEYSLCDNISLEDAIKVSCARSAAVSYRNTDYGLEKCKEVYERLVNAGKLHGSALEHCATPFCGFDGDVQYYTKELWPVGITHEDRNGDIWSGNFRSWIQYRKTIPNENHTTL